MTWVLLVAILFVLVLVAFIGEKRISWSDKLHSVNPGTPYTEWTAPDYVIQQVRNDYLMAVRWMRECALSTQAEQWTGATYYFAGLHLHRHQKTLAHYRTDKAPHYRDVLTAEHYVEVRYFSSDGERCLILDYQTERSITTYDDHTFEPIVRQKLEDATVIYQMVYDRTSRRWKIEQFVQELAFNPRSGKRQKVRVTSALPPTIGRDH